MNHESKDPETISNDIEETKEETKEDLKPKSQSPTE